MVKCPWGCGWEGPVEEYPKHVEEKHMEDIAGRKPMAKVVKLPEETMKRIYEALGVPEEIEISFEALPQAIFDLRELERKLSHLLQPDIIGPISTPMQAKRTIEPMRNTLREVMRKMGWKGVF